MRSKECGSQKHTRAERLTSCGASTSAIPPPAVQPHRAGSRRAAFIRASAKVFLGFVRVNDSARDRSDSSLIRLVSAGGTSARASDALDVSFAIVRWKRNGCRSTEQTKNKECGECLKLLLFVSDRCHNTVSFLHGREAKIIHLGITLGS